MNVIRNTVNPQNINMNMNNVMMFALCFSTLSHNMYIL